MYNDFFFAIKHRATCESAYDHKEKECGGEKRVKEGAERN